MLIFVLIYYYLFFCFIFSLVIYFLVSSDVFEMFSKFCFRNHISYSGVTESIDLM